MSNESKEVIAKRYLENLKKEYEDVMTDIDEDIYLRLMNTIGQCSNAREIKRIIKDVFNALAIRKICEEQ